MGFLSDLFDPGRDDRDAAAALAEQGIITGGSSTGPGGISTGFNFQNGQGSFTSDLGSFAPLLQQLQQLSSQGATQAGAGLPPALQALGISTIDELGDIDINRLTNEQDFAGLGQIFQGALGTAGADPFDLGADISARLRALSENRNQRNVNDFFDRLSSTGNLTSSAGIQRAGDLEQNIFEQGLQFDLAGLNAGRGIQSDAFARLLGASQGREAIGARAFGEQFATEGLEGQRALEQFGVGNELFSQLLRSQGQGANIALGGAQGAGALAQLPLAFQNALLASTGVASGSNFNAAGINQGNAQLAQSPLQELIKTLGGFFESAGINLGEIF